MNPPILIPLIITDRLAAARDFHRDVLGATVTIDMDGYAQVRYGDAEGAPEIAFMIPGNAPAADLAVQPGFDGRGLVISVPVEDVDAHHAAVVGAGAAPVAAPVDRPWGWRSFLVADPSGLLLDFFTVVAQPAAV